jgi:hypothetical protein
MAIWAFREDACQDPACEGLSRGHQAAAGDGIVMSVIGNLALTAALIAVPVVCYSQTTPQQCRTIHRRWTNGS